jgi:hypothetical protein
MTTWQGSPMARFGPVLDIAMSVCIATVAAFEAAIEIQRRFPDTQGMMVPIAGWSNLVPLALLALVGCLWLGRLFLPAKRTIQILTPLENSVVPAVHEVRGSIWPAGEPVQVFVLAGREWRPQQLPARDGALWSAQCRFDAPVAGSDLEFKIAAISRPALIVGPVRRLPWWSTTTSGIVRVRREG